MSYRVKIYPHNDLFNLAHYQREVINSKKAKGVKDAIGLDCLGCLISLAFTVEALVNFVGHKKITGWQERQTYKQKIKQVCTEANLNFDAHNEPFKTLWQLKDLRDSIAHGQPIEATTTVNSRDGLRQSMECPWDQHLTTEYINHAYDTVTEFERQLFENCQIMITDTLTSAVGY